jgi:NADH-quinone oxidoreductase subunit L
MWDDHRPDGGFHRFFAYLNLFCFAMLILVMGSNLALLFVGWEGVGLCSYLLIGFWYSDDANAAAGKKAFIANRIGDFGLLVAMSLLLNYAGALDWEGIGSGSGSLLQPIQIWPIGQPPAYLVSHLPWLFKPFNMTAATVVGLCLFLGCAGKSAQIPLYVWLPDAMAGPTPVSALIHAATMVTAGVYLVCRLSGIFLLSPFTMATIATIGAATAFFAATIGLVQNDIKKVLAYSTVSQLGFMFIGVGVGAFSAGFFHVFTHAFFKACLFLGAGSVIHAMHAGIHDSNAAQDMRNMGGLRKWLPTTYLTFGVSCLAIGGFPLTSGFFSKDEILYRAYVTHIKAPALSGTSRWEAPMWFGPALYWVGILAATMTAFYMFRALFLTFWGDFRGWKIDPKGSSSHPPPADSHAEHEGHHASAGPPHESPWAMTVPLLVLAAFAAVGGIFNPGLFSKSPGMEHWLEPVFEGSEQFVKVADAPSALVLAIPGVLVFFVGSVFAYWVYVMKNGAPARDLAEKAPKLYELVLDKWRIDELYDATVISAVEAFADTAALFDKWIIDGIIARLTSLVVAAAGAILRAFQTGVVHVYAAVMAIGLAAFGWFFVWQPQARATVREQAPGKYVVEASPGLGYRFRWHTKNPEQPDADPFTSRRTVELELSPGETKIVKVDVKNAFNRTSTGTVSVVRPSAPPPEGGAKAELAPSGRRDQVAR